MTKIFNYLFLFLKFILLLVSFGMTLYIILAMYARLNKDLTEAIDVFLPMLLLVIVFIINVIFRQTSVNQNIFYNICSTLVFSTIIFVGYRAIFDTNMILNSVLGYDINFVYFDDFIPFMQTMIYGLVIANIMFMINLGKDKVIENNRAEVEVL